MRILVLVLCLVAAPAVGRAEAETYTPAFDRPGIAFSTTVVPPGTFAVEQGLPDVEYSSQGGTRSTLYSADTTVRIGLGAGAEVQVGLDLLNFLRTTAPGDAHSSVGVGDSSLALKAALPCPWSSLSWALLGRVTVPSGEDAFTAGHVQGDLGTTWNLDLSQNWSSDVYVDVNIDDGDSTFTLSPSVAYAVSDAIGTYVEAGFDLADSSADTAVAGGGMTWMVTPILQLDASADLGLNAASPDVQGGLGISVFFDPTTR